MRDSDKIEYLPTREQIRQACREIQSEWTPGQWRERATGTAKRRYLEPQAARDLSGDR